MSPLPTTYGLFSRRVVTAKGVAAATVVIENGVISQVLDERQDLQGIAVEDLGNLVMMPGLVDSHVHVNEPGRTEWEGFESATRAAAAGGITTIADMPLNSNPVTTTVAAFQEKLEAARGKLYVDCAFYGGVVPGNVSSLAPLIERGVVGFKCFLIHSGIDDFPNVTEDDLQESMPLLAKHGVPLLVHAELEDGHKVNAGDWVDCRSYKSFLASRPRVWENQAISMMIRLSEKYDCPVHIVHLSSSDALPEIQLAIAAGARLTVETCPHYLNFKAEQIADGDTRYKCAPPIRELENCEKLWQGLKDGAIEFIVSDHSPCAPSLKFMDEGDFKAAWGGISSLQFRLPVIWTEAKKRGFDLEDVTEWLCKRPAKFLGMLDSKGTIAAGRDADFVVFDPDGDTKIAAKDIHHRHKVTPYEGLSLKGQIVSTYLRGEKIYDAGSIKDKPRGRELLGSRQGKYATL